jgi:uncharacterized protein
MPPRTRYAPGTFCWVDLTTTDLATARRFYGALFAWDVRETEGYAFFLKDGAVAAGLTELQPVQAQAGMPPSWSVYVAVDDADAMCARAEELGGTVHTEPYAIEDQGRMAVVGDPQGAVFLLWEADGFAGAEVVNEPRAWAWNDLQTPDPDAAAAFYRALFGWEIEAVPGSGGVYASIRNEGRAIGGVMAAPPGVAAPYWAAYFGVDGVGAALEHADAADGQRIGRPQDVPAGRFAFLADPLGAPFGVIEGQFDD